MQWHRKWSIVSFFILIEQIGIFDNEPATVYYFLHTLVETRTKRVVKEILCGNFIGKHSSVVQWLGFDFSITFKTICLILFSDWIKSIYKIQITLFQMVM